MGKDHLGELLPYFSLSGAQHTLFVQADLLATSKFGIGAIVAALR